MQAAPRLPHPIVIAMAGYLLGVPLLLALVGSDVSPYDAARVAQVVLLPVLAAVGMRGALPTLSRHTRWAVFALAALGLLSCALAANTAMALREFLNMACLAAIGVAIAAQREDALTWLPKAAAWAVTAYALPTLVMAIVGALQGLPLAADLPLPGFANRRYFNHVQTVALPLAAYGVMTLRTPMLRMLARLGLLASMVLLWITMARGSLLGFAAAFGVLGVAWFSGRREARPLALGFGVSMGVAAALAVGLQAMAASLSQASGFGREAADLELGSDHSRFSLWHKAWDMAVRSPLLGAGPMHYALGNHEKAAHPHSLPLQLLAEWGVPATLLVGFLWVALMTAMVRRLRQSTAGEGAQLGVGLLACWAAVSVDSWFSGLWVMPVSQMWLATLLGLSWAWLSPQGAEAPVRRWQLWPLLLCGALLLQALPEIVHLRSHLEAVKQSFPGEGARPRFWSHGHFGPSRPNSPP